MRKRRFILVYYTCNIPNCVSLDLEGPSIQVLGKVTVLFAEVKSQRFWQGPRWEKDSKMSAHEWDLNPKIKVQGVEIWHQKALENERKYKEKCASVRYFIEYKREQVVREMNWQGNFFIPSYSFLGFIIQYSGSVHGLGWNLFMWKCTWAHHHSGSGPIERILNDHSHRWMSSI